jgi:hypothetical protein
MPPAARGALFEKTAPLDPPQKLLIKDGHSLRPGSVFRQTMTVFGLFKLRWLKRRLKASIPGEHNDSNSLYDILYSVAFTAVSIHLKKPSGGPKDLIGPPCHGACFKDRGRGIMEYILNEDQHD